MDIVLKFQKLHNTVEIPKYETVGASGMDVRAFLQDDVTLEPMERKLIPTGIKIELPIGYEAQVRARSGLSIKHGLTLINGIGTVDSDYRGELCVPMVNISNEEYTINPNDRIAQMVICRYEKVDIQVTEELSDTQRSTGGFGSTGV